MPIADLAMAADQLSMAQRVEAVAPVLATMAVGMRQLAKKGEKDLRREQHARREDALRGTANSLDAAYLMLYDVGAGLAAHRRRSTIELAQASDTAGALEASELQSEEIGRLIFVTLEVRTILVKAYDEVANIRGTSKLGQDADDLRWEIATAKAEVDFLIRQFEALGAGNAAVQEALADLRGDLSGAEPA